jgi:hypothetical protein
VSLRHHCVRHCSVLRPRRNIRSLKKHSRLQIGTRSGHVAVLIFQQPAESLEALGLPGHNIDFVSGTDQSIFQALESDSKSAPRFLIVRKPIR